MTFFRWHGEHVPLCFCADHAWSGLWGSAWTEDGSRTRCPGCDGTGEGWRDCPRCHGDDPDDCERCGGDGGLPECEVCEGEGWQDCEPGDDWGQVIEFDGEVTGTGFDDEPTVVPTSVVRTMTWREFKRSANT
ncbi:hypothetical protein DZF91_12530 [Actinomadura logoneensis]|uniref:Uncharacterized protein n=1 Tax=Actinomadura logoneensis TaxID=2293572 RepID=A0A372JNC1_9ACTN|nr:hypothetical protein [Actinomadura logoneensis]RFU41306.1 hypothetical protein DZF91_12530 [Actinomadura logoneensis]